MTTIADTLNDIQKLQDEMSSKLKDYKGFREPADTKFIRDLMNFTTIYFFELLAHAALDALRDRLQPIGHPYADKYYSMYRESGVLKEFVRLNNISGMFLLWNIFEQYVDKKRADLPGEPGRDLEKRYKEVLRHIEVDKPVYDAMINEFNGIRLTRNSLHSGGIYRNKKECNFLLKGKQYSLKSGEAASPIRLMDAAETMWKHFVIVADSFRRSSVEDR